MTRRLVLVLLAAAGLATAADLTGTWEAEVQAMGGAGNPTFVLKQDGEKLTGSYRGLFGEAKVAGTVKDGAVEFEFKASYEGQALEAKFKGVLDGADRMKGSVTYAGLGDGTWTAKRRQ